VAQRPSGAARRPSRDASGRGKARSAAPVPTTVFQRRRGVQSRAQPWGFMEPPGAARPARRVSRVRTTARGLGAAVYGG
jgi:hypothetical protein